jgi:hypothetical protein
MQAPSGRGDIAPTNSSPMLVEGEWSASHPGRALPRGKDPQYPLDRRLDGAQRRSGHRDWRKNPLLLPAIESR